MSAKALASALAGAGLAAEVEGRERLALIRAADSAASRTIAARRADVMALAVAHGFSHVALEVAPMRQWEPALRRDAALPGD
jgi:hypothetical protein